MSTLIRKNTEPRSKNLKRQSRRIRGYTCCLKACSRRLALSQSRSLIRPSRLSRGGADTVADPSLQAIPSRPIKRVSDCTRFRPPLKLDESRSIHRTKMDRRWSLGRTGRSSCQCDLRLADGYSCWIHCFPGPKGQPACKSTPSAAQPKSTVKSEDTYPRRC